MGLGRAPIFPFRRPASFLKRFCNSSRRGVSHFLGSAGSAIGAVATSSGPIAWAFAGVMAVGGVYLIHRLERDRVAV